MDIDIFSYDHYQLYLSQEFSGTGPKRGRRTELAKYLGCQTSYLSLVFTERGHFSLEHALKTSEFLGHTSQEKKYFMLMVQKDRAGSTDLKQFYQTELQQLSVKRNEVKERINIHTKLTIADETIYYSVWFHSAIHVLCAFSEFDTAEKIANRLKLDLRTVKNSLAFLMKRGFIKKNGISYGMGSTRIHLASGSPMLPRHHANWRVRAINSVDREKHADLHYSGILGISKKDVVRLKDKLLLLLQEFEPILKNSTIEEPVVLLLDLFSL
jgi:uncharacterized protein (TIGR02147 family)